MSPRKSSPFRRRAPRLLLSALLLVVAGLAAGPVATSASTASAVASAAAAAAGANSGVPSCGVPRADHASCELRLHVKRSSTGKVKPAATSGFQGYTPAQLQAAYELPVSSGRGQVIAVVDAYDTPNAQGDLAAYRARYGLPACTSANGCFHEVNLGSTCTDPNNPTPVCGEYYGWDIETSLDLDMASAACPNCQIVLVEAASDNFTDIYPAIQAAINSGATEVSMSFGMPETADELNHDYLFNHPGIAFTAATGDCGYGVTYPATSPYVTAVGGTTLTQGGSRRGYNETAWVGAAADPQDCGGYNGPTGAGSGCSTIEHAPSWQSAAATSACGGMRANSDVSAVADLDTGVQVYDSADGGWQPIGGTSAASPFVAGIMALSGGLGYYPPGAETFYANGNSINDVTANTSSPGISCSPALLCSAEVGYDGPTGVGSVVGGLVPPALVTAPQNSSSTSFGVSWTPGAGVVATSYTIWSSDDGGPWDVWTTTTATSATFHGFPGHTYAFHAEVHNGRFDSGPPNGVGEAVTSVDSSAQTGPFTGLYAVDAYGTLHPGSSPPLTTTGSWPGWNIVRGIAMDPQMGGQGGYVLDGFGGIHPFGATGSMPPVLPTSGYWSGWDIARGLAIGPDGQGGYTVDGFGGVHPIGNYPLVNATSYWPGWDIARGITLNACDPSGHSGWVLDGWGGIHPFGGAPLLNASAYWPGWDIARAITSVCTNGQPGGYVLDGFGGVHPFGAAPILKTSTYWPGWDIARGLVVLPGGQGGYVVDGWGGFHPIGNAPAVDTPNYTPGQNLIKAASVG